MEQLINDKQSFSFEPGGSFNNSKMEVDKFLYSTLMNVENLFNKLSSEWNCPEPDAEKVVNRIKQSKNLVEKRNSQFKQDIEIGKRHKSDNNA